MPTHNQGVGPTAGCRSGILRGLARVVPSRQSPYLELRALQASLSYQCPGFASGTAWHAHGLGRCTPLAPKIHTASRRSSGATLGPAGFVSDAFDLVDIAGETGRDVASDCREDVVSGA